MGGGETGGEIELRESGADRKRILEPFADDEIGAVRAGPETNDMSVKPPTVPLRAIDLGQTTGGRVKIGARAAGALAPIVGDIRKQGRDPLRPVSVVLAPVGRPAGERGGPDPAV